MESRSTPSDQRTTRLRAQAHGLPPGSGASDEDWRGTLVGRYVLFGRVGVGGMGSVARAFDTKLERQVALKFLDASGGTESPTRLMREALALAKLQHPNVVAVYDAGIHDDRVFVTMELVEGQTLRAWLAEKRRGWREIVRMCTAAGRGLAAAHAAGMIHRDFKPDNIVVGSDGRARVIDFGLAVLTHREPSPDQASASSSSILGSVTTSSVAGTPAYMAPEQRRGKPLDPRADQYAFCVVLHEALSGARPTPGSSAAGAPSTAKVPRRIARLLERGLAARAEDRFPTLDALLDALERATRPRAGRLLTLSVLAIGVGIVASAQPYRDWAASRKCAAIAERAAAESLGLRSADPGSAIDPTGGASPEHLLRGYAHRWHDAFEAVCRRAEIDGSAGEATYAAQRRCLEVGAAQAHALEQSIASADAAARAAATRAFYDLDDPDACVDPERARFVAPTALASSTELEPAHDRLARAKVLGALGHYSRSLQVAKEALELVGASSPALTGRAMLQIADMQDRLGEFDAAIETLEQGILLAERSAQPRLAAQAWSMLTFIESYEKGEFGRLERNAAHARAWIERSGQADELRARLLSHLGLAYQRHGDLELSQESLREAIAYRVQGRAEGGPDHPQMGVLHLNLGITLSAMGRHDEALAEYSVALDILRRTLGPNHPQMVFPLSAVAAGQQQLGHYMDAERGYEKALALARARLGPDHPEVGRILFNLCSLDLARHSDPDEAVGHCGDALTIVESSHDDQSVVLLPYLQGLAAAQRAAGDAATALTVLERAEALAHLEDGADGALTQTRVAIDMAQTLLDLGRLPEARTRLERAEGSLTDGLGPDHELRSDAMMVRIRMEIHEGELDAAISNARLLVSSLEQSSKARPWDLADARLVLADALEASKTAPDEVVRLRDQAHARPDQVPGGAP